MSQLWWIPQAEEASREGEGVGWLISWTLPECSQTAWLMLTAAGECSGWEKSPRLFLLALVQLILKVGVFFPPQELFLGLFSALPRRKSQSGHVWKYNFEFFFLNCYQKENLAVSNSIKMVSRGQGERVIFSSKLKIGDLREIGTHLKILGLFAPLLVTGTVADTVH